MKRPSAVLTFDILIRLKEYRRELLKSHLQLVPQFPRADIVLGLHCISNHQSAFQLLESGDAYTGNKLLLNTALTLSY